jgi:hypothetical protein
MIMLWYANNGGCMRRALLPTLVVLGLLQWKTAEARPAKKGQAGKQVAQQATPEEIHKAFDVFCDEWMQKLVARENDNVAHINWNTSSDGVEGEYVGYTSDHTCVVKDGSAVPVGKITYLEVLYAKRGKTIEEARQSPAQAVETTGVTEIFRYDRTKWIY